MELDIDIADPAWRVLDLDDIAARAVRAVLVHLRLDAARVELVLRATDDAEIAQLNGDFRGKAQPTNVLSWPAEDRTSPGASPAAPRPGPDGMIALGDIALGHGTCLREAEAGGIALADHVTHLIVHGVLHLLGYDHETETDARLMEGLEVEILGNLGLDDPYRERTAADPH